ncbi:MAG: hypothetical protein M1820_002183 [Bogoriella megaspora]|nr:MAG: hypothetical protein M1820_002183 [Bogoriella megaspora]
MFGAFVASIGGSLGSSTSTSTPGLGQYIAQGIDAGIGTDEAPVPYPQASSDSLIASSSISASSDLSRNASLGGGDCWAQWASYWSLGTLTAPGTTESYLIRNFTSTWGITNNVSDWVQSSQTLRSTWTTTHVVVAGGFTKTTLTSTLSSTETLVGTTIKGYTNTVQFTQTEFDEYSTITLTTRPGVSPPTCVLNSTQIPGCQSQWEEFVSDRIDYGNSILSGSTVTRPPCTGQASGGFAAIAFICTDENAQWSSYNEAISSLRSLQTNPAPSCSQASIGAELCTSIRSVFINDLSNWASQYWSNILGYDVGSAAVWSIYSNSLTSATTPINTALLAPGCSIGCQACGITGNSVRLLYWPVSSTAASGNNQTGTLTVQAFGTTFTSPTVYISLESIFARDSCSGIGSTHGATIIPITDPAHLSSLWQTYPYMSAAAPASFNFTDLNDPVPQSIYNSQPVCWSWTTDHTGEHGLLPSSGECPTDTPYSPILVVPSQVLQSIDPLWATCSEDIRGLYDPPYALHGAPEAAGPTTSSMPAAATITPAPGPAVGSGDPVQTPPPKLSSFLSPNHDPGTALPISSSGDPRKSNQPETKSGDPGTGSGGAIGASVLSIIVPASSSAGSGRQPLNGDPQASRGGSPPIAGPNSDPQAQPNSNNGDLPQGGPQSPSEPSIGSGSANAGAIIASFLGAGDTQKSKGSEPHGNDPPLGLPSDPGQGPSNGQANSDGAESPTNARPQIAGQNVAGDPLDLSAVIIGGTQTVNFGSTAVVDGTAISVGPNGAVIPFASTVPIPQDTAGASAIVATIGGETVARDSADPSAVVVGTQTLRLGQTATIGSTPILLGPGGLVVSGSSSLSIPRITDHPSTQGLGVEAVFTLDGKEYTAFQLYGHPGTALLVGPDGISTTLSLDSQGIAIDGKTVSLNTDGLRVGASEVPFSTASPSLEKNIVFTDAEGNVHTVLEGFGQFTAVVDGSVTLTEGGKAVVVGGETLSLGANGIVEDGTTRSWRTESVSGNGDDTQASTLGPGNSATKTKAASTNNLGGIQTANANGVERNDVQWLFMSVMIVASFLTVLL